MALELPGGVGPGFMRKIAALTVLVLAWPISQADYCRFDDRIRAEAESAGVPGWIAVAVCHAESSGDPRAVGPGGARGLFQFECSTWNIEAGGVPFDRAFDPETSIRVGVRHLSRNRAAGARDPRNFLAWHNAGVRDWRRLQRRWSTDHPNGIYRAIYRGRQI